MCTYSKGANEQTLKTELRVPFYLSVHAFIYCYKRSFVSLYLQKSVYLCCSIFSLVSMSKTTVNTPHMDCLCVLVRTTCCKKRYTSILLSWLIFFTESMIWEWITFKLKRKTSWSFLFYCYLINNILLSKFQTLVLFAGFNVFSRRFHGQVSKWHCIRKTRFAVNETKSVVTNETLLSPSVIWRTNC